MKKTIGNQSKNLIKKANKKQEEKMEYVHQLNPDDGATLAPGVSTSFGIAVAGDLSLIHI